MWKFIIILALSVALSLSQDVDIDSSEHGVTEGKVKTNCTCGLSNKSPKRIIGGEESGVNEWPMMVAVIVKNWRNITENMFTCGGTIITHRHIITAGHCLHDDKGRPYKEEELGFVLGAHNLKKIDYKDPNILRTAEKFIKHPKYKWAVTYDVAIVILPKIEFSKIIGPACLPTERFDFENKRLKIAGWGFIDPSGPISDVLKKTNLISQKLETCWNVYKHVIGAPLEIKDPYQACTSQPGTSPCRGDSGGPIMWVDPKTNRYMLVAVPSYAVYFCHLYPQVSSDASYFEPWIQQVISETYPEEKTCAKISS
uniref:Venom S1 protease 23 n=1 Tax=Platymeris rhadamanthus TaxID=1134088 RepID=A0A6B9L6H5_PLARH|nr:venom S1 protease 23 [Platymeris rhadamanthus]